MLIWKHKKIPMFARYYIPDSFVNWTIEMLDLPRGRQLSEMAVVIEDSRQWILDPYHYIIFYKIKWSTMRQKNCNFCITLFFTQIIKIPKTIWLKTEMLLFILWLMIR